MHTSLRPLPLFNLLTALLATLTGLHASPFQGNGIKIGEISQDSVIVWTRLTTNQNGDMTSVTAAPGSDGEVRVTRWPVDDPIASQATDWTAVNSELDYTQQFRITGLTPATTYALRSESRPSGGGAISSSIEGQFTTTPTTDSIEPVLAAIVTCQSLRSIDDPTKGHKVYEELAEIAPDFFVHTGDVLYYDNNGKDQPDSKSVALARQHWNRMFSYTWNKDFPAQVACFFMKDDHDTLKDDAYPGQSYGSLSFQNGLEIFSEQTPSSQGLALLAGKDLSAATAYHTRRWGKDLQFWILEGREHRSVNTIKDGPYKTILGAAQKQWLKDTIEASDATFKVVISPSPIVGPDKPGKADNHSNDTFHNEGQELRDFLAAQANTFVINGDRHWQYASVDPATGLREYGCGPINATHATIGGNPGFDPNFHTFFAARGGYLTVLVERVKELPQISFRYHDIDDTDPKTGLARIVHQETLRLEDSKLTTLIRDHLSGSSKLKKMAKNDGSPLAPHTSENQGMPLNSDDFNRVDFVVDICFTTPPYLNEATDFVLAEIGGTGRGTSVAVVNGKLSLATGDIEGSIYSYTDTTPLAVNTRYSLRLDARSQEAGNNDRFEAFLWKEGDPAPIQIIKEMGLSVTGFSGRDGTGVGFVNSQFFNPDATLPRSTPDSSVGVSLSGYNPNDATPEHPLPSQPEPQQHR
ncbi:alkaline phosphatase D family protein [Coraliomargarita sp. W4R53]